MSALVLCASPLVACSDAGNSGAAGYWQPRDPAASESGDESADDSRAPSANGGASGFSLLTSVDAIAMELVSTTEVTVRVASFDFVGNVELTIDDLPTDVTATFAPATLTLAAGQGATAKLRLTTSSKVKPAPYLFNVLASSTGVTRATPFALTVQPILTLRIPMNAAPGDPTMFGAPEYVITAPDGFGPTAPVMVKFVNGDTTPHIIHGSDANGFVHGNREVPLQFNEADLPRYLTAKASYAFYLHDQGAPETGRIVIQ